MRTGRGDTATGRPRSRPPSLAVLEAEGPMGIPQQPRGRIGLCWGPVGPERSHRVLGLLKTKV